MYKKIAPDVFDALLEHSLYAGLSSRLDIPHSREVEGKYSLCFGENNSLVHLPEPLIHIGAFSKSGAGKSNLLLNLIAELSRDIPFWIFESAKNKFRILVKDSRVPNLLVLPWWMDKDNPLEAPQNVDKDEWRHSTAENLARTFGGMSAQVSLLLEVIHGLPDKSTLVDLHHALDKRKRRASFTERTYLDRITNKTGECIRGKMRDVVHNIRGYDKKQMLKWNVVYEYTGLASEWIEFWVNHKLHWVEAFKRYNSVTIHGNLIDEAWHLLSRDRENFLSQRIRTFREQQEFLLFADQNPSLLHPAVISNSNKICLAQSSGIEAKYLCSQLGLDSAFANQLLNLGVGEAIFKLYSGFTAPFLGRIPLYPWQENISNAELERCMKEKWKALEYVPKEEKASVAVDVNPNRKLWERFLISLIKEPLLNNSQRYDHLRISHSVGNRIKSALLELGFVKEHSLSSGTRGGSFKVLEILKNGCSFINEAEFRLEGKGSYEHKYFQNLIAEEKKRKGCRVVIEMNLNGKAADIGIVEDSELVGYELAFGNGERETENIRKDLEAGYSHVIMICKNETIKKQLLMELPDELKGKVNVRLLKEAVGISED
ncbi:MAG: hypothetical protein HY515_01785 [Candidatus Aenigmarchaeota archaeon]|nr:hypothetical protein [Candidatus Aenigmarchaeota archaeon]